MMSNNFDRRVSLCSLRADSTQLGAPSEITPWWLGARLWSSHNVYVGSITSVWQVMVLPF